MYKMSPAQFARLSPQQRMMASVNGFGAVRNNAQVNYAQGGQSQIVPDSAPMKALIRGTLEAPTVGTVISGGRYVVTPSGNQLERTPFWTQGRTRLPESQIVPGRAGVTQLAGLGVTFTDGRRAQSGERATVKGTSPEEMAQRLDAVIRAIQEEFKNYDIDPLPRTLNEVYAQLERASVELSLVKSDFDKEWPACALVDRGAANQTYIDSCNIAKGLRPRVSKLEGQIMALTKLSQLHPERSPLGGSSRDEARALVMKKAAEARDAAAQLAQMKEAARQAELETQRREQAAKDAAAAAEQAAKDAAAKQAAQGSNSSSDTSTSGNSSSEPFTEKSTDLVTLDYSTKTAPSAMPQWVLPVGVGVVALGLIWWARSK
jgi:hypothetical protein